MSLTDEVKRSAKSPIDLAEEVACLEVDVLRKLAELVWHGGTQDAGTERARCYANGRVFLESGFAWITRAIATRIVDAEDNRGPSH